MEENFGVKLYLDEDTKKLPCGLTSDSFIEGINTQLRSFDQRLYLASATAYGAFPNYEKISLNSILSHSDVAFSFNYLPIRDPLCDKCKLERYESGVGKKKLSYLKLKECIFKDVDIELQQVNNELSPILICTSDKDFVAIIETLKSWGYKVLLFANSDAEESLLRSAHLHSTAWF